MACAPADLSVEDMILRSALACFVEKGFHGTSIRVIATAAGLSIAGLYHYYSSKSALLDRLVLNTMDDLLTLTQQALDMAPSSPMARFDAVVSAHVRFHCERAEESFVGNSELRSLAPDSLQQTIDRRDRQQRIFDEVILAGVASGHFRSGNPVMASRALVTMCTAVASWYRGTGPASPDQIVVEYLALARSLLGTSPDVATG